MIPHNFLGSSCTVLEVAFKRLCLVLLIYCGLLRGKVNHFLNIVLILSLHSFYLFCSSLYKTSVFSDLALQLQIFGPIELAELILNAF